MATSYWYGSSVSAGYRPRVLGPRQLAGMGDADGAPGWATPFDSPLGQRPINMTRATPRVDELALSGAPGWPSSRVGGGWGNLFAKPTSQDGLGSDATAAPPRGMVPTVDPSFIFQRTNHGTVRYNNAPFYWQNFRQVRQTPWPVYPNRSSFKGPYGEHARPYYAATFRTPKEGPMPGWPEMRVNRLGIAAQFLADKSRAVLPSRGFVQAQKAPYTPKFAKTASTAWPGGQYWLSRSAADFRQEPAVRTRAPGVGARVIR